jgi:hypothetical protein
VTTDAGFRVYVGAAYASSGTLISAVKDANPAPGKFIEWTTISWTAATPGGTAVQFRVAGSNSKYGSYNFVGPDGTASTFFTNGGSLAHFNGLRYLKYQADLSTANTAVTPAINDVTVCFNKTAVAFTDDPLEPGTIVKAQHITEMRTRVDAQRVRFGLAAYPWTDPALAGATIKAVHISELRLALGAAYTAHSLAPPPYTDPTLTPAATLVKAIHITELRGAIVAMEGSP